MKKRGFGLEDQLSSRSQKKVDHFFPKGAVFCHFGTPKSDFKTDLIDVQAKSRKIFGKNPGGRLFAALC